MKGNPLLALALLAAPPALAQAPGEERVGRPYLYGGLGGVDPERNPQLANPSGQLALALGLGYRQSRYLAWEAELAHHSQRVDTPTNLQGPFFFVNVSGRTELFTTGAAASARLIYPGGRFEPYVGGGLGLYRSTLRVPAEVFGISGSTFEKNDTELGLHVLAGADYHFGQRASVGLQYRKVQVDADFGPEIAGTVKAGAELLLAQFRFAF